MPLINLSAEELATVKEALQFMSNTLLFTHYSYNREDRTAKMQEIDAALAALARPQGQQGAWEPMPPGMHYLEYGDFSMTVSLDGSLLTMQALDGECYPEMYIQLNPSEYRLCRLSQPAAGTGEVTLNNEVREAIESLRALVLAYVITNNKGSSADKKYLDEVRIVRAWLDSQEIRYGQ